MKKAILFIFLIVICFITKAQYPLQQNLGSSSTLVQVPANGALRAGLITISFTDTVAANLTNVKYYDGAIIKTTSPIIALWYRHLATTEWVQILPSGGSTGQRPWLISGQSGIFTSPVDPQYIGLTSNQGFGILTNNIARLTISNAGAWGLGAGLDYGTSGYVLTSQGNAAEPIWAAASGSGWSLTGNAGTTAGTNFIGTTDAQGLMFKVNNVQSGYIDYVLGNVSFGYETLLNIGGGVNLNTAFGHQALKTLSTAIRNTAFGYNALTLSNGNSNTAFGYNALAANTTSTLSTAVGSSTLAVSTGAANTAVGGNALTANTTGVNNTAIGVGALSTNTIGRENTAIGRLSLDKMVDGQRNTAIGYNAMSVSTTGSDNTAMGQGSLTNTTGSQNIGIGMQAGYFNTSQSYRLYVNSILRSNIAGDTTESIIYGAQDATASSQRLYLNSKVYAPYLPTDVGDKAVRWNSTTKEFTVADTTTGGGGGANTALSNLAAVAINTSLLLGTSDAAALGSTTKQWSDLFLAEGGVINWDNGDATLTQVGNNVTLDGAAFLVTNAEQTPASFTSTFAGNMQVNWNSSTGNNVNFVFQDAGTARWYIGNNSATGSDRMHILNASALEAVTVLQGLQVGINNTAPTARLHLGAGVVTANYAPLKFTSGPLNTTAEAGAVEFLTDKWYGTITTGAARKEFVMTDNAVSGNLLFTDNTYDIGASGATRPRTGYFGTSLFSPLVIGGTGTTDDLIFKTTTGVGTTGSFMDFLVGNNGAVTAMRINDVGGVGILAPTTIDANHGITIKSPTNTGNHGLKILALNETVNMQIGWGIIEGSSTLRITAAGGAISMNTTSGVFVGGTSAPVATAILESSSTTKGWLPPRMTTTQKNAISSPAEGLIVYDTTLHKLCVYTGSAWETITSL